MITHTTAIVRGGVLHPEQPLSLPDETRVSVRIDEPETLARRATARRDLLAWLAEHPLSLGGRRWTRDDLYDRH